MPFSLPGQRILDKGYVTLVYQKKNKAFGKPANYARVFVQAQRACTLVNDGWPLRLLYRSFTRPEF